MKIMILPKIKLVIFQFATLNNKMDPNGTVSPPFLGDSNIIQDLHGFDP
jgi:hypothetical protein